MLQKMGPTKEACDALHGAVSETRVTSLRKLFMHGLDYLDTATTRPALEADQISSHILPTRIAHTATTPTTGSLFVRLCKDLGAPSKHPDLILKCKDRPDIGFGEVSLTKEFGKDQGNLCRPAIWSKRALDHLVATYEVMGDLDVVFFQVVSSTCKVYKIRRIGTVDVIVELAKLDIVQGLEGLLAFTDQVESWLHVPESFGGDVYSAFQRQPVNTFSLLSWTIDALFEKDASLMNQASFPIGLGLTAAAHVYLSNLCWRKTAKLQRRYLSHHLRYKTNIRSLALHDLETLSSLIQLLDANIKNIDQLLLEYPGRPPKSELRSISVEELKHWMESYSLFKNERGNMIQSVTQEMMCTDDRYVDLRTNQVCTYLLSTAIALRYVLSTEPAARFMIKHLPRLYTFGSWIAQKLGVNSSAALPPIQISSQITNLNSSCDNTWGSLVFQVAPTLFLSGIHFTAGLRCQWVIRRIQQDRKHQLLFIKRVCFVSMFLSLRHSRLKWLLKMSEACEEFQKRREASGDYSEVDQAEIDAARQPSRGLQRASTHNQLRVLVEDPESPVYALLNDPHDSLLFEYMAYSTGNSSSRPSPLRTSEYSFGPDLERVDTAQYLGDSRERLRIMRLEYMAMKTELVLFCEL